ncbi:MAG: hypothetical protein QOE61_1234 [Micromonosporaceae bacterium]|nr:hypothetical protein [Micromonosporaceae bacterium]
MSAIPTVDEHDEPTYPDRFPSPDILRALLAEHGYEPDDLRQMMDLAAVGITARWWRNTKVEDWHAGADIGALSDVDMFRINTHTTAKVRERLRTWCRQQRVRNLTDVAASNPDTLETVIYRLYRWFTNPGRRLVIGCTLRDVAATTLTNARAHPDCTLTDDVTVESELAEYHDDVAGAAGHLLTCMDKHDPRGVFYIPAASTIAWATGWWGKPDYPSHVDTVFAALQTPDHRFWRERPIPTPPAGTDMAHIREQMLTKPWDLSNDVSDWLINKVGEHYIRN